MPDDRDSGAALSTVVKLLPVYAVYVFIAGWTFSDYYFRFFGVNPRWLDIAFHDTLTKGFTILFSGKGTALWSVYLLMATAPVLSEGLHSLKSHPKVRVVLELILILGLIGILPLIYWVARDVGISQARMDKGIQSTLPTISFRANKNSYTGHLLFLKNNIYYIHDVNNGDPSKVQELSIFRAEEVSDIRIIEFQ